MFYTICINNAKAIKRTLEKKTADILSMFVAEMNHTKREFDRHRKNPPLPTTYPKFSGAALWARSFSRRISRQMQLLQGSWAVVSLREYSEVDTQFNALVATFEEYIRKQYMDWVERLSQGVGTGLQNKLIVAAGNGFLKVNFSTELVKLFAEVEHWERLGYSIPFIAMENTSSKDRTRFVKEHVVLLVRDYNAIMAALDTSERRLFADKIKALDKKIGPGIAKLTWTSKGIVDFYVRESRRFCKSTEGLVMDFKSCKTRLNRNCRLVSETSLIEIEKKRVYDEEEFEKVQAFHRRRVQERLLAMHRDVMEAFKMIYRVFQYDSQEVLKEWDVFISRGDKQIEDAMRQAVKRSLQELSRAINGDKVRREPVPLFRVNVVLEANSRVEFKPSMSSLTQMVNNVSKEYAFCFKH